MQYEENKHKLGMLPINPNAYNLIASQFLCKIDQARY
jgi:hypothetical protein